MATKRAAARKKSMMDGGSLGGFTIIEVVLVLAIAGLIFMMVFIALPNLQRAQRDTQRKNALGEMAAQIQQYQGHNNGRLPGSTGTSGVLQSVEEDDAAAALSSMCTGVTDTASRNLKAAECFVKNYMNSADDTGNNKFVDPDGWTYGLTIEKYTNQVPTGVDTATGNRNHMIYMYIGAACDGEYPVKSTNPRNYALWYKLEGNSAYCSTNS